MTISDLLCTVCTFTPYRTRGGKERVKRVDEDSDRLTEQTKLEEDQKKRRENGTVRIDHQRCDFFDFFGFYFFFNFCTLYFLVQSAS